MRDPATGDERVWTFTFVADGAAGAHQIASIDGPLTGTNDVTTYSYYQTDDPSGQYRAGDLQSVTNPLGHTTTFTKYDPSGRVSELVDANGVMTRLTYSLRGWLAYREIAGAVWSYQYDAVGNVVRSIDPTGVDVEYGYDDASRLEWIADSVGNRIDYVLDDAGNRREEQVSNASAELKRRVRRVFDAFGELERTIDSRDHETTFGLDGNGNQITVVDPMENGSTTDYDPLERISRILDALDGEVFYAYNERDNLTAVTDQRGLTTTYEVDGLDNLWRRTSPDTGVSTFDYDPAGNRTQATDARGVTTSYTIDALGRPKSIIYPDTALNVTLTYDQGPFGIGQTTGMAGSGGTIDFEYNAQGDVVSETHTNDGVTLSVAYEYDEVGRLTGVTYPSGRTIRIQRDALGREDAIHEVSGQDLEVLVENIEHEPFGPASGWTYGNGVVHVRDFDLDGRPASIRNDGRLDLNFGHDPRGLIDSIDNDGDPAASQQFGYDELARLETAAGAYGTQTFDYDEVGNRLLWGRDSGSVVTQPEGASNRLATVDGIAQTYDPVGNLIGDGTFQYDYDARNRLVAVRSSGSVVATYEYNPRGERVRKTVDGVTTRFLYGPEGELLGEYDATGQPLKEYVYLTGQPVAMLTTRAEQIILDDPSGTVGAGTWSTFSNPLAHGGTFRLAFPMIMPMGGSSREVDDEPSAKGLGVPNSARFEFHLSSLPQLYEVSARWMSSSGANPYARFTISNGESSKTVLVDQTQNGWTWQRLGTFHNPRVIRLPPRLRRAYPAAREQRLVQQDRTACQAAMGPERGERS
ncbi:MAG: hypothetical protein MPN21_18075 [Thermoanaerobaculia bacterium]|nr:hypothetical protein [Thermoanaerobaculia bacterium]